MTKLTVYLDGSITTVTPFANSPAGNRGRNDEALLPRMPINIGGAFKESAFIPSSTLRGRIRRAAAVVLLDRFVGLGLEPTFDDWLLWAVGGVKGSGKENIDARERARTIEASALLAMFGAGDSPAGGMVGGRFLIDPGIPSGDVPTTVVKGARAAENRNPALTEFLSPAEMERVQAYTDANSRRSALEATVKRLSTEIAKAEKARKEKRPSKLTDEELVAAKAELTAAQAKLDEVSALLQEVGSDNSIGRPLSGYEVIAPGVVFPHRMTIKAASEEQIGFVIEALSQFAVDPVIGAHASAGCGRIAARYDVRVRRDRERETEHVGTLSYGTLDGLVIDSAFLDRASAAWRNAEFDPQAYRAAARNS